MHVDLKTIFKNRAKRSKRISFCLGRIKISTLFPCGKKWRGKLRTISAITSWRRRIGNLNLGSCRAEGNLQVSFYIIARSV